METAKVDIEKLQLLNDRIVQTIEALNQVRMSVHGLQGLLPHQQGRGPQFGSYGLSHTGGFSPQAQLAQQNPWIQQNPWVQQNPWIQASPWASGYGLSHTGFDQYRQGAVDPFVYARIVQTFPFFGTEVPTMRQFY
jgi:hypothetical protein